MKMQIGFVLFFGVLAVASAGSTREAVDKRLEAFPKFLGVRVGEIGKATSDMAEEIAVIFKLVNSELETLDKNLEKANAKIGDLNRNNADLTKKLGKSEEDNKALELELGGMGKLVASLKEENRKSQNMITAKNKKIASLENKLQICNDKLVPPVPQGYKLIGKHYVKKFSEKKIWQDAAAACKKDGAQLLTVEDDETGEWIKSEYPVWTGGNDHAKEGVFVWADGKPVGNNYWAEGEPDNGIGFVDHDCILVNSPGILFNNPGQLADHQCSTRWAFACEIPKRA